MNKYKEELDKVVVYLANRHENFVVSNTIINETGIDENTFRIISESMNVHKGYLIGGSWSDDNGFLMCGLTNLGRKYYEEEINISKTKKFLNKIVKSQYVYFFLKLLRIIK